MDNKDFKRIFCEIAKSHGFKSAYGTCYIESTECIFVLELQKSNYSNLYYLNMKTYIQGYFDNIYSKNKDTLKNHYGSMYGRPSKEFLNIFDLDFYMPDAQRIEELNMLFIEFIIPYSKKVLSLEGIKELVSKDKKLFTPLVEEELDRIIIAKQSN
jgi:hypothetical protein